MCTAYAGRSRGCWDGVCHSSFTLRPTHSGSGDASWSTFPCGGAMKRRARHDRFPIFSRCDEGNVVRCPSGACSHLGCPWPRRFFLQQSHKPLRWRVGERGDGWVRTLPDTHRDGGERSRNRFRSRLRIHRGLRFRERPQGHSGIRSLSGAPGQTPRDQTMRWPRVVRQSLHFTSSAPNQSRRTVR